MEKKFPIFKTLTLLVMFVLGMGTAFAANCAADYVAPENPVWDGTSTQEPCTKGGYYIIDNAAKLAWYAQKVNDETISNSTNVKLTADLDLGGNLWTPICAGTGGQVKENNVVVATYRVYKGIFDGNGHVIKNLYINGSELAVINKHYAQNIGFIGVLGGGTIKNLTLENVDIQASTNAGDILGRTDSQISVGAVVGWMSEVASNKVENCMSSGTIRTTGSGQGVGGIVGNAKKGTVTNCLSLVEIQTSGSKAYVGGIIGITKTDVTVSSCVYAGPGLTNTGSNGAVGGIAGNVWSGNFNAEGDYFEGESFSGVGTYCSNCTMGGTLPEGETQSDEEKQNYIQNSTHEVDISNVENVACELNGKNTDGTCKTEPWSVGETSLSLNGYGTDGYKIVFDANGGAFADNASTKNKFLQAGMAITADEIGKPTRETYTFMGWALTSDATAPAADLGTVSQTDTIFAVWEKKIKVTFDANGGTFPDASVVKDVYITKGDPITVDGLGSLPVTYCEKYSVSNSSQCLSTVYFTGWKDNAENTIDFNNHDVLATVDVTYKAIWTNVITYSVTFHANNNTTVDIVVFVDQGTVTSRPDDPTMDGYDFVDWYDGDVVFNFSSKIESSKDLYAHWTPKKYNVTYVLSEGGKDRGDNPVNFTLGEGLLALNPPTAQDGYTFDGWFYDSDFKQKATAIDRNVVGDKTFYAKLSKIQYRIMYLADNNSQGAISDKFKEHNIPITLESAGYFNRKGYAQIGWATEANGEKVYEFGASYAENAALTLYPAWTLATYTITYVCEVCSENNPATPRTYMMNDTKNGNLSIYNPVFSSDEYEFKGWYWDEDYTNRTTNIPKSTLGDVVLYGKMLKYYYITYELNGSSKSNNRPKYTVETATFQLADPDPREGFTFGGWFDNAKFEGNAVTQIVNGSTGDITLYAKWYPYVVQYGAVTITEHEDGTKTAVIDGEYTGSDAIDIPTPIEVDNIVINRTFTQNTPATIVLPFTLPSGTNLNGAKFYYLKNVVQHPDKYAWKATMTWIGADALPAANTPYTVICTKENCSSLEFGLNGGKATFKTNELGMVQAKKTDKWYFVGTYVYKTWESVAEQTELADGLVYGIAGQNDDGVPKGTFAKATSSANVVHPMRAYMRKRDTSVKLERVTQPQTVRARGASYGLNNIGSEIIEVEFVDDEKTTAIGRMNTVTGEIKIDRWFDLKGRHVKNVNRAAKGAYYGKKVFHE